MLTAADLGDRAAFTAADFLAMQPCASADHQNGRHQAQRCRVCHDLKKSAPRPVGPNLRGVFTRENASLPDFDRSQAMREVRFRWSPDALDAWFSAPARFLPGDRMSVAGIGNADDRADLIACLLEAMSEP